MATTTATTPPSEDTRQLGSGLTLDVGFVKSLQGILTAVITLVSIIAFICVYAGRNDIWWCNAINYGAFNFFGFVSMTTFLTGLIFYLLFLFTFQQKLAAVPWNLVVLAWCGVFALFYLIASALAAAKACGMSGVIAGAVFGFLAMVLLGIRGFFAFLDFRSQRSESSQPTKSDPPPQHTPGNDFVQY